MTKEFVFQSIAGIVAFWSLKFLFVLTIWTFVVYFLHKLAHKKFKYNLFNYLHKWHHRIDYRGGGSNFQFKFLYWNFGDVRITLDLFFMLTLPLLVLTYFFPSQGIVLLIYHYCSEVFLSEQIVDHNPKLKGWVTKYFAWGEYHLLHHKNPKKNLSFIFTIWDKVFKTN